MSVFHLAAYGAAKDQASRPKPLVDRHDDLEDLIRRQDPNSLRFVGIEVAFQIHGRIS